MDPQPLTVIGETVADAFLPDRGLDPPLRLEVRPGGGPANTAVALARLGTPTRFLGRLSTGAFGRLLRRHLAESDVDVSGCVAAPQEATLAVATVGEDGQAEYDFYARGTADWQWTREELAARVPDGAAVHTGSLALATDPGGPLIEEVLERVRPHATVSIDPNVRPGIIAPAVYRERLPRWARLADVIRLSEDDLDALGLSLAEVCDTWHASGVRLIVVTRGADGAVASLSGERVEVPGVPTRVADTVGAGDAFMAALLHWLNRGALLGGRLEAVRPEQVRTALTFAAHIAAATVGVPGADPPWARDLAPSVLDLLGLPD
ncbi:carbohydrate kinase family protein [Actinomadura kijaniata]|nr:carbohydrate kinase [Actinomadura kijaniata]